MDATWIESSAKGRHGGPVRAGMWSTVVIGTHPIEANQEVWLEISADDESFGPLPAYWLEDKGVNSLWHVPVPPYGVGARLKYRSGARRNGGDAVFSPQQEVVVRPNIPDRIEAAGVALTFPEALAGNRMMTVKVDGRGSTYDVFFPTVGLHSDVRPSEGDLPQSRSHFRAILGGLAVGRRLDWFAERLSWETFQRYQGATNQLLTELRWRHGPIRVLATDFVAMGPDLPTTQGGAVSAGQYIKRFRISNGGDQPRKALFGVYVHAEVNGGIGEPGLSWHDGDRTLLATNRGHGHANRKLARDSTVEFAIALDDRGDVLCEPAGPNEAMLLRTLELPAQASVVVDLLVSGAFTGWRGDQGTFEHWLKPALCWFRSTDLDALEHASAQAWDDFVEPLPTLSFSKVDYSVNLRRSALAAALHCDVEWGAIAAGFDRGLNAYCWPRDAIWTSGAMDRAGHPEIGRRVFQWLARVASQKRNYDYWFQKYSIDGSPEWETPAVDQTAIIPWALERHLRRTGDLDLVTALWPIVERAAGVCTGASGHPGLRLIDDLHLVSSAGIWDNRFGAFLYSNASVVAGLRASGRLALLMDRPEKAMAWLEAADRIWERGVLSETSAGEAGPGLVDRDSGRFLEARRLSLRRGLWTEQADRLIERVPAIDVSMLAPAVPFGLLAASDSRVRQSAEAILRHNMVGGDPTALACWSVDPTAGKNSSLAPGDAHQHDVSSLATLWMARYLIQLGRETGEGKHWKQAVALLDGLLERLGPLGLNVRQPARRDDDDGPRSGQAPGVWGLHAMLIETLLDIAGLDYDAAARQLILEPVLPPLWPQVGLSQPFTCGDVSYRLARGETASSQVLSVRTRLDHPVTLKIGLTCPSLLELGFWRAQPQCPPPAFDRAGRRMEWCIELAEGHSECEWSWG
jgi:glucoamylase